MYGIIPKRINKTKIEHTAFLDINSDFINEYSIKETDFILKSIQENLELDDDIKENIKEEIKLEKEHSLNDKTEFYEINYKLFTSKKSHFIELIEKFLDRTDLNLNEIEPDINYIICKYKTYNCNEFIKTKQYSNQGYTEIQCEALTNKGSQCSRKTETSDTTYCGIHKKKQANGTIYTGFFKK